MIKNAYAPGGPRSQPNSTAKPADVVSDTFSGEREVVHSQLAEHLHTLGHEAEHIGEKLGLVHSGDGKEAHAAAGANGDQLPPPAEASTSTQPQGSGPKSSDDEPEITEPAAVVVEDEDEDERSRSHTRGVRSHLRDRLFGRPRAATDRTHVRTGSAGGGPTRDPAARLRADLARDSRRDESPARSIRFVDDQPGSSGASVGVEGGSGAATPTSLTSPANGGIGSGSGNDTPGSRVMFDLPTQRPR